MKKLAIIAVLVVFLCGCVNVNISDYNSIINEIINSDLKLTNTYRTGYKYYVPTNILTVETDQSNEVLKYKNIKYYMYVDLVSYYNKTEIKHEFDSKCYLKETFNKDGLNGYIEINKINDNYLIEIMYNYAKIEVIVGNEKDIKEVVMNSLIMLSSISYNDDIIKNLLGEDVLNYSEEKFSIFDEEMGKSNFLDIVSEYENYDENEVPDYDLIN